MSTDESSPAPPAGGCCDPVLRAGVDLVDIADVAGSLEHFGDRYTARIYTAGELADSAGGPDVRAARLAARFAAKEAVIKVLRPSGVTPRWTDVEVVRVASGATELRLSGLAREMAARAGLDTWAVSITHESTYAAAVVVASGPAGAR
jgi:holo-[acyl-carrier protein] synthase